MPKMSKIKNLGWKMQMTKRCFLKHRLLKKGVLSYSNMRGSVTEALTSEVLISDLRSSDLCGSAAPTSDL